MTRPVLEQDTDFSGLPAKPARRRFRFVLLVVLGVVLVSAFAGCGALAYFAWEMGVSESVPSDEELFARFKEHARELAELQVMIAADRRLNSVDPTSVDPGVRAAGVSSGRIARYRSLMDQAGIDQLSMVKGGPQRRAVWFQMVYTGSVLTSDEKGYLYSIERPHPVVDSLDGDAAVGHYAFRHISGNWYLYRWIDP